MFWKLVDTPNSFTYLCGDASFSHYSQVVFNITYSQVLFWKFLIFQTYKMNYYLFLNLFHHPVTNLLFRRERNHHYYSGLCCTNLTFKVFANYTMSSPAHLNSIVMVSIVHMTVNIVIYSTFLHTFSVSLRFSVREWV